ncbi:TIGR01620 family protein [Marinobacterium mangrovicola]|uniref:Putative membrane protein n=1 Tax=Marinobacterium mangrovicola TaxID=1476959 RepID=A0A4R1GJH7_9GAMM|nr:TIGR01620 family protein [Marinobacterium mangrovicola]TCK08168.1 putative membrane protein [Marinobacterium mangrovicola]
MSESKRRQGAVWLDLDKLQAAEQAPKESARVQEVPLDQVVDIADNEGAELIESPAPRRRRGWKKLFGFSLGAVLVTGVGAELYRLLNWGFSIHPGVGIGFSALLALLAVSGGVQIWRSLKGLRQLRDTERLHDRARELLEHSGQGRSATLLAGLERRYQDQAGHSSVIDAIRELDSAYSDREVVQFLSRHALESQDVAARRCVQRYSVESGVMVALSPWATFDMLLVGWRNLRMLREIAGIYGIAPGAAAQWKLLKSVLHGLAFAGASEMAIDAGSAALGSSLTSTLSARAGQGLGAGLFTARTGLQAQKLCRPLPLERDEGRVFDAVAKGIVQRLGGSK